jgi:hypothetical protein
MTTSEVLYSGRTELQLPETPGGNPNHQHTAVVLVVLVHFLEVIVIWDRLTSEHILL